MPPVKPSLPATTATPVERLSLLRSLFLTPNWNILTLYFTLTWITPSWITSWITPPIYDYTPVHVPLISSLTVFPDTELRQTFAMWRLCT